MRKAYLIDPKTREVSEIDMPLDPSAPIVIPFTMEGDSLYLEPNSPFDKGVHAFIFHPIGLKLGRTLVLGPSGQNPTLPLAAIQRRIQWVSCLMVLGGISSIIPRTTHQ